MGFSLSKLSLILSALSTGALLASCGGGNDGSALPAGSLLRPQSSAHSLKCFTQDGGTCSIAKDGTVTLGLPNPPAQDAGTGVYFASDNSLNGATLASLHGLSFTLTGSYESGSPRAGIPVTYNGNATNVWVYPVSCAVANTGSGSDSNAVINPVGDPSDTANDYCLEMQGYSSPQQYWSSWSAFVGTYGSAVISGPTLFLADADNANGGTWTLSDISTKK